jgi:hypothetical protein
MDDRSEYRDGSGSILLETCRIAEDELEVLVANTTNATRRDELSATLKELRRLSAIVAGWRVQSSADDTTASTVDQIMTILHRVDGWSTQTRAG